MKAVWVKGLKGEAKAKRISEIKSYRNAFDTLKEILESHFEESTPDYDCPSWSHKQAHVNGANQKLQSILNLLNIED